MVASVVVVLAAMLAVVGASTNNFTARWVKGGLPLGLAAPGCAGVFRSFAPSTFSGVMLNPNSVSYVASDGATNFTQDTTHWNALYPTKDPVYGGGALLATPYNTASGQAPCYNLATNRSIVCWFYYNQTTCNFPGYMATRYNQTVAAPSNFQHRYNPSYTAVYGPDQTNYAVSGLLVYGGHSVDVDTCTGFCDFFLLDDLWYIPVGAINKCGVTTQQAWIKISVSTPWGRTVSPGSPRSYMAMVSSDAAGPAVWFSGGHQVTDKLPWTFNDVWYASNIFGGPPALVTSAAPWSPRMGHGMFYAEFAPTPFLIVYGGWSWTPPPGTTVLADNDVWFSRTGGVTWGAMASLSNAPTPRYLVCPFMTYNNASFATLYFVGGATDFDLYDDLPIDYLNVTDVLQIVAPL